MNRRKGKNQHKLPKRTLIMYEELERNADVFEREQNIVMLEEE
jgi:hypothetical protein